jgi:hypothetical protein
MKIGLDSGTLAAFLCHSRFSTTLSSFLAFETNVISLGFCVRLSEFPPRLSPSGGSQQDSNYDHRGNDDQNNHNG